MKTKAIAILMLAVLFLSQACSDFEDINKDPVNPATVPAEMLLPGIISGAASSVTGSYGRAGQFVQHLAWLGGTSEESGRYNLTGASFREEWNGPMRLIKDVNQLYEVGKQNNQPQYQALALICKVYILSVMSDAYGDIPYAEAGMGNVAGLEFPHFQPQQEVYSLMIQDLETANQILKALPSANTIKRDILFNGSAVKWRRFANSLKIRILMRESQKVNVNTQVAQIFNNPTEYPVFTGVDDQATLVYNNSTDFYQWFMQNPPSDGSGVNFDGDERVSDVMVNLLQQTNDPRLRIYAAPTKNSYQANKANSSAPLVYRGQRAGLSSLEQNAYYTQTGLNKNDFSVIGKRIRKESRAFLMTFSELLLLKSEAMVRNMGVNGDASAVFASAIRASFDKWAQVGQSTQEETPYISTAQKDAWFTANPVSLSGTGAIRQIAEQLWIDSFLNGFEGWAGWRRLGYPQITPGPSVLSPIPVRYVYSDNEQNNPSLIEWVNQNYGGKMPDFNTKVWFQP